MRLILLLKKNQKNYRKGLTISIFSIAINILLYVLIIIDYIPSDGTKVVWYGFCLTFGITALLLAILYGIKKPNDRRIEHG